MENGCQEHPHTWRMLSFFLLMFLMMILMAGVTFTEPVVSVDADANSDAELRGKIVARNLPVLGGHPPSF